MRRSRAIDATRACSSAARFSSSLRWRSCSWATCVSKSRDMRAAFTERTSCRRCNAFLNSAMNSGTLPAAMQDVRMPDRVASDAAVESAL